MTDHLVRLNKYLKDQDLCSRRKADEFIAKGYIKVNGQIITELGFKLNPITDKVEVLPGAYLEKSEFKYIVLNKPKGYVCSKSSLDGKLVFELVPKVKGLTYAGRLDKDSHGLVLLSNDGKFVYKALGSEFECEKEYIVKVNKPITPDFLNYQSHGLIVLDDKRVKKAKVRQISGCVYNIILTEGIYHQIKRMAENQGYRVVDLERIRIGNIQDKSLALGKWRYLTRTEVLSF